MTVARRSSAVALSGGPRATVAVLTALVILLAAGCGGKQATPSPAAAASAGASRAPTGSAAPTASPKRDPATAAISAFVALVTKDGFSYQATFTGDDRHTTDIIPMRDGLLQVSGDDVLVRTTFSFQGQRYTVEHRYVGGKAWIRFDAGEPWKRLTFRPSDSMAAFAGIRTTTDVAYLGPAQSGTKTFYKVQFRSAIVNPVMIPAGNLAERALTSPTLTLLIDGDGQPIRGTATIDGQGRVSGQLQEIVIDLTVTFTKVGQAVTIKAP